MAEKIYTKDGIVFGSVKIPQTLFKEGPLGIVPAYKGENAEGNKGITYSNDKVTEAVPFINAVDIDWNGAEVSNGKTINTTSELLNWINEKLPGESAYTIAHNLNPAIGNVQQWLDSLKGEKGDKGNPGITGLQGNDGKSAYDVAVEHGFEGNEEEWLASLKGEKGDKGDKGDKGETGAVTIEGSSELIDIIPIENILVNGNTIPPVNKTVNIILDDYLENYATIEQLNTKISSTGENNFPKIDSINYTQNLAGNGSLIIHYGNLVGYINANTQADWNETSTSSPSYIWNKPTSFKYTNNWTKETESSSNGLVEYFKNDSISRVVYKEGESSGGLTLWIEATENDSITDLTGQLRFIRNSITGNHSIAIGWANSITGDYSSSEGKLTTVNGNYSHVSGCETKVDGDYSFGGGLDDGNITTNESHPEDANEPNRNAKGYNIKGNYSFGYGKNIVTNNNGEIAFGNYNKSRTLNELQIPELNTIAYDNKNNEWTIVNFYRLDIGILNISNWYQNNTNEYYTFILEIFNKLCKVILENYNGDIADEISGFLNYFMYGINYYKENYTYTYSYNSENNGLVNHNIPSHRGDDYIENMVIGVIAKDAEDNHDFFIWGPNSLYYEHEPITMLSFGKGNWYERNNLIEVTDDGNIHYANGDRSLFELESQLDNISHNINLEVSNISTNNSSTVGSDLIIPINDSTPSILIVDNFIKLGSNQNRHICLDILNSQHNYYKKTLIIDLSKFNDDFSSNGEIHILSSQSISIYGKEGIATGNKLELSSFGENEDGICRIILETIQNKCIVEFDECLKKIETE